LSGSDAGDSQCYERYQQSTDHCPICFAVVRFSTVVVVHTILLVKKPLRSLRHTTSAKVFCRAPSYDQNGLTSEIVFSRPAQRSLTLWPARSRSRQATLYIESSHSFVASAAASIA